MRTTAAVLATLYTASASTAGGRPIGALFEDVNRAKALKIEKRGLAEQQELEQGTTKSQLECPEDMTPSMCKRFVFEAFPDFCPSNEQPKLAVLGMYSKDEESGKPICKCKRKGQFIVLCGPALGSQAHQASLRKSRPVNDLLDGIHDAPQHQHAGQGALGIFNHAAQQPQL